LKRRHELVVVIGEGPPKRRREGIAPSYMTRVLRLTLLAPDIVEAILDGKQGPGVTLARVLEPWPLDWIEQRFQNLGCKANLPEMGRQQKKI